MKLYITVTLIYTALCLLVFCVFKNKKTQSKELKNSIYLLVTVTIALSVRIVLSLQDRAFWNDINIFKMWAQMTETYGLKNMYHVGAFLDYPPGYIYILYATNIIRKILNVSYDSIIYTFFIKIPPIIADIVSVLFIYKIANENIDKKQSLLLSICIAFCPAMIFNSAVWGQVDSYYTLLLVLTLYFISKNSVVKAAIFYALAFMTKPQALLFGPVLLFWVIEKKSFKIFFKAVSTGILTIWALALPFSQSLNPLWLIDLYKNTFGGYPYMTVNGYNLYMILGQNWKPLSDIVGSNWINPIVILITFLLCIWGYFCQKNKGKIFTTSIIFITVFFNFCTMMHERYMFPAIILLLIAYIYTKKDRFFYLFLWAQAVCFLNITASFAMQYEGVIISKTLYSFISCATVIFAIICVTGYILDSLEEKSFEFTIKQRKIFILSIFFLTCFMLQFFRLGSLKAPETFYQSKEKGEYFVLSFDEVKKIDGIYFATGMGDENYPYENSGVKKGCNVDIFACNFQGIWQQQEQLINNDIFTWKYQNTDFTTDKVAIRSNLPNQILNEIVFFSDGKPVKIKEVIPENDYDNNEYSAYNTVDEQKTYPKDIATYYNSMYFDEIYHARTAFEQLNGYSLYENTHPPLGKILISEGIKIFGMTPFGWRVMGAIRGFLMVALMFVTAKELFGRFLPAFMAAFLFAFDFMRYTQTRISTIDSFLVLFILLMFLFMIKYIKIPVNENKLKQAIYLLLSGFFAGCTISVKWNGAYSIIALALVFFIGLFSKCKDLDTCKNKFKVISITCFWCILCFIVLPFTIYFISYLNAYGLTICKNSFIDFINSQINMFSYHNLLVAEHPFASRWYTWPFVVRPIWYFVSRSGDMVSSISAFGNPIIWLSMLPSLIYVIYKVIKNKDKIALFIFLGYFTALLPWAFIGRITFIYHYFPVTIFGILSICYFINNFIKDKPKNKKYIYIYSFIVLLCFVIFFPVISGYPVRMSYVDFLELLPTWHFN